jgi:hypothetical protein
MRTPVWDSAYLQDQGDSAGANLRVSASKEKRHLLMNQFFALTAILLVLAMPSV